MATKKYDDAKWIGQKFGLLTVEKAIRKKVNGQHGTSWNWLVRCECGERLIVVPYDLLHEKRVSCGCHGRNALLFLENPTKKHEARLKQIWRLMIRRCYDKKSIGWYRYGGRGIIVCEEWRIDFDAFFDWALKNGYDDGLSIDRIDNDGNYTPNNCRWVTVREQARNRSTSRKAEINGETKTIVEWCEEYKMDYHRVCGRINTLGWTPERALTEPIHNNEKERGKS